MLAFFRKHEKGFFLLLFLPTIVGLGVTSVIASVLTREQNPFHPVVFGQEYGAADWEQIVLPFKRKNRDATLSSEHEFFAKVKDAERAGIQLSDDKVGLGIKDDMTMELASYRASERVQREHVDPQTDQGRRLWYTYFIEEIQNAKGNWSEADYREALHRMNMTVQEYETYRKRVHAIEELTTIAQNSVTVSADEVWKAYRDRRHSREAEIVALDAVSYVPSSTVFPPTDAEIDSFYKARKADYDIPKRVELELVAAPLKAVKAEIPPTDEASEKAYWEKHPAEFSVNVAPSTSAEVMVLTSFSDCRERVREALVDSLAKDRAQGYLEIVAAELDKQRAASPNAVDLTSAAAACSQTKTLVVGKTGLRLPEEIKTGKVAKDAPAREAELTTLVKGFASFRWVENEKASPVRTSDPLKGEDAICILRTATVQEKKTPEYADVKAKVRKDFIEGGELEIKRWYDQNYFKYRQRESFELEIVKVDYAEFARRDPQIEDPSKLEIDDFFKNHQDPLWPNKSREQVADADIVKAFRVNKAMPKAMSTLDALLEACKKQYHDTRKVDVLKAKIAIAPTDIIKTGFVDQLTVTLDPEQLGSSPYKDAQIIIGSTAIDQAPPSANDLADKSGRFFAIVRKKIEPKLPELDDTVDGKPLRETVRRDLLLGRALERAHAAAEKMLVELHDLRGEALAKALAKKGLKSETTGFFDGDAHALPGIAANVASQVIQQTYTCEVEGGFERVVGDRSEDKPDQSRVLLVRCAHRKDPAPDGFKTHRDAIRSDLLEQKRKAEASRWTTERLLKAKGIVQEHVRWVRERRDGPDGQVGLKARQIFVPNDTATIDSWLDTAASARLAEAEAALREPNARWDDVCARFSEEEQTRGTGGMIDGAARGDVSQFYGADFEASVFELKNGDKKRIKSKIGWHYVDVTLAPHSEPGDPHPRGGRPQAPQTRMSWKQIVVKTDAKLRNLPEDVEKKARELARAKAKHAVERLDAGESFTQVAADEGEDEKDDSRGKGQPFSLDYASPAVLMALRQPLEPSDPEVMVPEELTVGGASEWHLMLCARDPQDKEPSFKARPKAPRLVYELVGDKADVDKARAHLLAWKKKCQEKGTDLDFPHLLREWKKHCERASKAPSRAREGAFGYVAIDDAVREWPDDLLASVYSLPAGKRTGIFETKAGFRIVEVASVETKPKDDPLREQHVAEAVLRGTDWNDGEGAERSAVSIPPPDWGGWGD